MFTPVFTYGPRKGDHRGYGSRQFQIGQSRSFVERMGPEPLYKTNALGTRLGSVLIDRGAQRSEASAGMGVVNYSDAYLTSLSKQGAL